MTSLTNSLLRLQTVRGTEPYGRLLATCTLADVVAAAVMSMAHVDLAITTDVDPDLRVASDADQLEQILVILVENANAHGATAVTISSTLVRDHVTVVVIDDGPGVSDDLAERLFKPFSRGSSGGGAGLGLAICRRLVENQGGRIEHRRPPDGGAGFHLTLEAA